MSGKTTLYIHPLCYSSYKLLKEGAGIIKKAKITVKSVDNPILAGALKSEIVSVPFLMEEGKPLAVDPLDADELKKILYEKKGTVYEPWKMLARSILASGYLTTLAILHGPKQLGNLLPRGFVEASLRSHLGGPQPRELLDDENFMEKVWARFWEKAGVVVAYNFARHTYWALKLIGKKPSTSQLGELLENADEKTVTRWIVSMSSLGRSGNLVDFGSIDAGERIREAVGRALDVLREGSVAEWIVEREQGIIENDDEFWEIFEEHKTAE